MYVLLHVLCTIFLMYVMIPCDCIELLYMELNTASLPFLVVVAAQGVRIRLGSGRQGSPFLEHIRNTILEF
jgi:hypothetical protein